MAELNLTIIEIIVLQVGAIILGIAIHFFITSRRSLEPNTNRTKKLQRQFEDWKMKYFNEAEIKDRELAESRMLMKETAENAKMYKAEVEELKARNQELEEQLQQGGDLDDLAIKDEEISILHQKIKMADENNRHLLKRFDDLQAQNKELQSTLNTKVDNNVDEHLQTEFNELQDKLKQLEAQNQELLTSLNNKVEHNVNEQLQTENNELHDQLKQLEAQNLVSISALNNLRDQNQALQSQLNELRSQNEDLQIQLQRREQEIHATPEVQGDYLSQLQAARQSLQEHSQKISQLIGQVDLVKENEEKQQAILRENEELSHHLQELQNQLQQKDSEINQIKQKEHLAVEMHSMLDNAYAEFNSMQVKMQKLESQVAASKMANLEFEDLKESHYRLTKDFENQRSKLFAQISENQKLNAQVNDLQDNLNEANFHRQQLQKRVTYLEELNNDLHTLSEANRSLESRLKSIGELESRLNMVAEERDQLLKQQEKH